MHDGDALALALPVVGDSADGTVLHGEAIPGDGGSVVGWILRWKTPEGELVTQVTVLEDGSVEEQ